MPRRRASSQSLASTQPRCSRHCHHSLDLFIILYFCAAGQDCYLAYLLNEFAGQTVLVFAATCNGTQRLALLLRNLGFDATCLHGQMTQPKRLGALNKFKSKQRSILIATDGERRLGVCGVLLGIYLDRSEPSVDVEHWPRTFFQHIKCMH